MSVIAKFEGDLITKIEGRAATEGRRHRRLVGAMNLITKIEGSDPITKIEGRSVS